MSNLSNIGITRMVSIKILAFIFPALMVLSDVVAATRQVQAPDSNYIQQEQSTTTKAKFVEGEVLVKYKSGVPTQIQQDTAVNLGGRSFTPVGNKLKVAKIKLREGNDVIAAVQAYQADSNVEYAQPNYIYHALAIPNDASYGQLWGMNNTGQTILNPAYPTNNPGAAGNDINAEAAWDEITDCRSTVVAVIDTGINYTQLDLAQNLWDGGAGMPNHGWDFVDSDNDPMPTGGGEDHGTHIAGTIGARGNNGIGVTGVCWRASIMSVRVLGATGSGTTAAIVSGIEFAADNGARVINMSLGAEVPFDLLFDDAITYAQDRDVVIVVAAGNAGTDIDGLGADGDPNTKDYPCGFTQDNLICVTALDQSYNLASFSNFGATSVDVGAPGTNTLSSWGGQIITDIFTGGWTLSGGWGVGDCFGFDTLSNPANWCSGGTYGLDIDDRAYKNFNLSAGATAAAELSYFAAIETEMLFDFFSTAMKSSGGDPFTGSGIILQKGSGSTLPFFLKFRHDISQCTTSTCSLGFRLESNSTNVLSGLGIDTFTINTLQPNSAIFNVISGTSMAAPHVAGIATMVRAYNPDYTYTQTVEATKFGGEVFVAGLAGITTTGQASDAMGAIAYITEPTGLSAVVQ